MNTVLVLQNLYDRPWFRQCQLDFAVSKFLSKTGQLTSTGERTYQIGCVAILCQSRRILLRRSDLVHCGHVVPIYASPTNIQSL